MALTRRRDLIAAAALLPLVAQAQPTPYEPQRGQGGKYVLWLPTPDAMVERLLRMAALTPDDFLMDLGSGDGKIVIAAARAGTPGLGVEYNADLVEFARRRAQEAGVAERARFERADIFDTDLSRATVIWLYLLPTLNVRLRPRLLALKPGTRVVSHSFPMGDWAADETTTAGGATGFLWIVPANFVGDWLLRLPMGGAPQATGIMTLRQTFQRVSGDVAFSGFATSLRDVLVRGDRLRFALTDADGQLREFDGRIAGDTLRGTVSGGGQRVAFEATRTGEAPPIGGAAPVKG